MRLLVSAAVLLVATAGPAAAEFRVLEKGYTTTLVGREWAYGELHFGSPLQTDGAGNVYRVAGGAPGTRILRASRGGVAAFAELRGEADAYIMGLWFDEANTMIVLVQRLAPVPYNDTDPPPGPVRLVSRTDTGLARELSYYRIKGFPTRETLRARGATAFGNDVAARLHPYAAQVLLRLSPAHVAGAMLFLMAVALTAMARQLQRDVTGFRRRR